MTENKLAGLSNEEVNERILRKETNFNHETNSRTYKEIFRYNLLTFFNFLNIVLLCLVLYTKSYRNAFFGFTFIMNTVIGIVQEIRAKRILDKIAIQNSKFTSVVRDGFTTAIPDEQIVLDDLAIFETNDQISVDSIIVSGAIELNESLLTGEVNGITKGVGDHILSGSVVISGRAYCRVEHVGKDNYIDQLISEARQFRLHTSKLYHYLNRILKIVSIIIVPLGIALFMESYFHLHLSINESIISMTASQIGMIPQGLVLLTSISLTIGTMILVRKNVLVQELYSIETLARVNTLCLDKTGTLTLGRIAVKDHIELVEVDTKEIIGNMLNTLEDVNETSKALSEHFPHFSNYQVESVLHFNSTNKYSAVSFRDIGTYYLGATTAIFDQLADEHNHLINNYTSEGYRVIALGYSPMMYHGEKDKHVHLVAIIILSDVLRPNVDTIFEYFNEQHVELKIISGDDPVTVANIAKKCGLHHCHEVNCATLSKEDLENVYQNYNIYGRTTPDQKRQLINLFKQEGKTVAMTGDGVNDMLALKDADCSIALGSGSPATKNISNLILLDDDFESLTSALMQGRRVINNISNSAVIYLIKTFFSSLLTILTIIFGVRYPFQPIQLTVISMFAVGVPTFFLTYEPNFHPVTDDFFKKIFYRSIPVALSICFGSLTIVILGNQINLDPYEIAMICVMMNSANYFFTLYRIYQPLNRFRKVILAFCAGAFFITAIALQNIMETSMFDLQGLLLLLVSLATCGAIIIASQKVIAKIYQLIDRRK